MAGGMLDMRGAGVLLVAVLMAACNGGAGRTVETLPPPVETTSTTPADYAVPPVIDVAYVEKVMAALDRVYGDAIRTLAAERQITEQFLSRLAAIYGDRFFRLAQESWTKEIGAGLRSLAATPGDPKTAVVFLVRQDSTCVIAAVRRDFRAIRSTAPTATPQRFVALVPRPPATNNPTGWVMAYDGWTTTGEAPEDPCDAS